MDDDFDIPELNRIGALMRELSGEPAWPDPAAGDRPAKAAARPAARRKPRARPRPLAAETVAAFAGGSNWANAEGFRSPLRPATPGRRLGSATVATFGASANWKNAHDGPQGLHGLSAGAAAPVGGPPETLENFMGGFGGE